MRQLLSKLRINMFLDIDSGTIPDHFKIAKFNPFSTKGVKVNSWNGRLILLFLLISKILREILHYCLVSNQTLNGRYSQQRKQILETGAL